MSEDVPDENNGLKRLLGLLWRHGQNVLVYPAAFDILERRRPPEIRTPAKIGIPYLAPLLRTSDGIDLSCYLLPQTRESLAVDPDLGQRAVAAIEDCRVDVAPAAAEAQATVIVFHGNSAHHWEDMLSAKDFFEMKCNVFLLSYRGYSFSGGSPNEKGLQIDAQTALDYILNDPYLSKTPIILYGHSLGGAVAIDLASRNPSTVSAIIVSNTFTSIPDIVRRWPLIGIFSFLCHQKWRSEDKMRLIPASTPILMLSGRRDEVIPPVLMDRLWIAALRRGISGSGSGSGRWSGKAGRLVLWRTAADKERKKAKAEAERGKARADAEAKAKPRKKKNWMHTTRRGDIFARVESGTHNDTPDCMEYWVAIQVFVARVNRRTTQTETHRAPAPPSSEVEPSAAPPPLPPPSSDAVPSAALPPPPPPPPPPSPPPLPAAPKLKRVEVDRRWRYIDRTLVVIQDQDSEEGV